MDVQRETENIFSREDDISDVILKTLSEEREYITFVKTIVDEMCNKEEIDDE